MGLLSRFFASVAGPPANRNPADDYWYGPVQPDGTVVVDTRTVTSIPEVYDCLQVISQTIAALPLVTYRRESNGGKRRFDAHPIADLLHHRPNAFSTAYEFRAQMTWDLALHRNAFAEIRDGQRGVIDSLIRLDPAAMWVVKNDDGGWVYEIRDGARTRRLDREQVFHLRAPPLTSDNILGRSLVEDGRTTFARALALQDFARRFFENDATPGGVVEIPGKFGNPEQALEFKRKWQAEFSGRNRHKVGMLDGGSKFVKLDVQNDKAQFIETYREVSLQCLRFWRMPPHKVGILDKATFSNIEQQSLEFVSDTLMPWIVAWEQAIRRDLIVRDDVFFVEHNVEGLLRGDIKARYEAYRVGREWGWLSADDVRARENMNPLGPGVGNVYLQPLNMAPAGSQPAERAAYAALVEREVALFANHRKLLEITAEEATTDAPR
jgi:HK97 family phage portal protein